MSFGTFGTFGGFGNKQNNSTPAFGSTFGNNNQQNNGVNFANQPIAQTPAVNPLTIILQGYKNIFVDKTNQDDSVFSCVMFNYCPANLREDFLKDEKNRELYASYFKENPDPENMVPVRVLGFDGLKNRIESQKAILKSVNDSMDMLQKAITQTRAVVSDCNRMALQCNTKQSELEEKLIRVLGKLEAKSNKSQLVVTNEAFVETLIKLQKEVTSPTTGLRNRLSSIYNALNTYGISMPCKTIELEDADSILKFLESQEAGLEKIVHILKQTQRELDLILTNPFVHITYTSYFCLFPFILKNKQ